MTSRKHNRGGLRYRTEQAAVGASAVSVPITFQRTLMPRSNMDQALVTGLTLAADHAITSLIQDGAGAHKVLGNIERREESFETAFDLPPPVPEVSGSHESLVPFETLARQGRRFVWNSCVPTSSPR
jgi:uncharacterized membrane protein